MSNLREAAQQALEALKDHKRSDAYRVSIAMHVLSTALAQEQAVSVAELQAALGWPGGLSNPVSDKVKLLRMVADLRAEPEPMAWRYCFEGQARWSYEETDPRERLRGAPAIVTAVIQPLYTAPPAPKREPLTDDALKSLLRSCDWRSMDLAVLARAIERAHGIGGEE